MTTEQTYEKIDPEFKVKWLAALRSGEYRQTSGALRCVEEREVLVGFCCLGVGCDVLDPTGWQDPAVLIEAHRDEDGEDYWDGLLGWRQLGPSDTNGLPFLPDPPGRHAISVASVLASKNDGNSGEFKHSFAEIADWIEGNL